jgi:hypothetical protein
MNFKIAAPREASIALFSSITLALFLMFIGITGIGTYGLLVFLATPFFMGLCSSLVYSRLAKQKFKKREHFKLGLIGLFFLSIGILLFAIEGLICIIMAAPLGIVFNLLGILIGSHISELKGFKSGGFTALFMLFLPTSLYLDLQTENSAKAQLNQANAVKPISTAIEIAAPPEVVWESVVHFPMLPKPKELLFQLGIAYPTHAAITGQGVGAIRKCYFSTGAFIEPITVWDFPSKLAFDVSEQPDPMTELTLWKIHPPHLSGYFNSQRGQFELQKMANGHTRLIGTTWYSQRIYPIAYWSLWSDTIIHSIHTRVLNHIKMHSEKGNTISKLSHKD